MSSEMNTSNASDTHMSSVPSSTPSSSSSSSSFPSENTSSSSSSSSNTSILTESTFPTNRLSTIEEGTSERKHTLSSTSNDTTDNVDATVTSPNIRPVPVEDTHLTSSAPPPQTTFIPDTHSRTSDLFASLTVRPSSDSEEDGSSSSHNTNDLFGVPSPTLEPAAAPSTLPPSNSGTLLNGPTTASSTTGSHASSYVDKDHFLPSSSSTRITSASMSVPYSHSSNPLHSVSTENGFYTSQSATTYVPVSSPPVQPVPSHLATSTNTSRIVYPPSDSALPFWIGCWNMGAKELSDSIGSNPSIATSSFEAWIPRGYKMYIVGLQESISENTYQALDQFFSSKSYECSRLHIPSANNDGTWSGTVKIAGRGDGSFLYPKCTSIACWIHRSARGLVTHLASSGFSLGMTQGSKGGAALALKILDSTFVFVSVHLSSTTVQSRRQSYISLIESIGNTLGDRYFQLLEQFHHIFFLGDLNFRLQNEKISAADAVKFMQRNDLNGLLKYDELLNEIKNGNSFYNFIEAPIDFFPTYKKHENRKIFIEKTPQNIYWVHEIYKTIYKEPWYKKGGTAQRTPSWCDRILRHSLTDQRNRIQTLEFHPMEEQIKPTTSHMVRVGGVGNLCTYRALEDSLTTSDHTAVSCGFQLILPNRSPPSPLSPRAFMPVASPVGKPLVAEDSRSSSSRNLVVTTTNLSVPSTRMSSSSVSSPNPRLSNASPTVFLVRLLSVRVLDPIPEPPPASPVALTRRAVSAMELGQEPKYVRILFPAPYENGSTLVSSRQIIFAQLPQPPSPHRISISAPNNNPNSEPATSPMNGPTSSSSSSSPKSTSSTTTVTSNTAAFYADYYCQAEFRCLVFEDPQVDSNPDRLNGTSSPTGNMDSHNLPPPAPFHFLLKMHSVDDLSGQCCVPLPREAFIHGSALEFTEPMTRDGIALIHPETKQIMLLHFILHLSVIHVHGTNTQSQTRSPTATSASTPSTLQKANSSKHILSSTTARPSTQQS